jgi:hypothetical protein
MITRARWVAGLATLILAGASVGVALAQVNESVDVQLGRIVKVGGEVKFTVSGYVSRPSRGTTLKVFVSDIGCAATADRQGGTLVVQLGLSRGGFSKNVQTTPGVKVVPAYICAYVTEYEGRGDRTVAYASARAAASTGYSLAFTSVGRIGTMLRSIVTVNAPDKASLLVFSVFNVPCAATAEGEKQVHYGGIRQLLRREFESGVSDRPEPVPPESARYQGTYRLCAYLEVEQRITLAHAEAFFEVG